jgi:hypothetical protein
MKDIVRDLETYIQNNTTREVHFDGTEMKPSGTEWINFSVVPLASQDNFVLDQLTTIGDVYITCYGKTKQKVYEILDEMDYLFRNKDIPSTDTINTGDCRILQTGTLNNSNSGSNYFVKVTYRFWA